MATPDDLESSDTSIDHPDDPVSESQRLLPVHIDNDISSSSSFNDQVASKYPKWVPIPIRKFCIAAVAWGYGPNPPKTYSIEPWCPGLQHAPIRLLDRYAPEKKHRAMLWVIVCATWLLLFSVITYRNTIVTDVAGWGVPTNIGCTATYWVQGNRCGLNGNDCRPFNDTGMAFRCPADCQGVRILNPRTIGSQEVNYVPLVVGGPSHGNDTAIYRSDSFICGAAIHAGMIDGHRGGCGVVSLVGQGSNYASSEHNGIKSFAFDSYFPSSFIFASGSKCDASDDILLLVSLFFSILISLFTTSAPVFFFTIFIGLFFHVGLSSDPPGHSSMSGLVSNILGKCLPATFCALVMYKFMGVRKALFGVFAQIDKTVLWLGGCWIGALNNHTFAWIPLERLDSHDLQQQPGAKAALAGIVFLLFFIVLQQAYSFQQEGRLYRYLKIYGILLGAVVFALLIPNLSLRIHHYVLALLLLPGTAMQTRPALFYQGLLVGLFINGIARWGFDSILQTRADLIQDGQLGSLVPNITEPIIQIGVNLSTIVFAWDRPPPPYNGISVLVNDVERYRGYTEDGYPSGERFIWTRGRGKVGVGGDADYGNGLESGVLNTRAIDDPEYFRFAFMEGTTTYDYTKPGIWMSDGSWEQMEEKSLLNKVDRDPASESF